MKYKHWFFKQILFAWYWLKFLNIIFVCRQKSVQIILAGKKQICIVESGRNHSQITRRINLNPGHYLSGTPPNLILHGFCSLLMLFPPLIRKLTLISGSISAFQQSYFQQKKQARKARRCDIYFRYLTFETTKFKCKNYFCAIALIFLATMMLLGEILVGEGLSKV